MSFPGRPPMPMPGMPLPPGIIPPPPYGMPGMHGMMPVPPGIPMVPPPMMGPVTVVTTNNAMISKKPMMSSTPVVIKKPPTSQTSTLLSGTPEALANSNYEGSPITVFVGNISDKGSDILIRQMLQKCGTVNSWKRVQGANGKLQAFGFCEYGDPESALRAIRILHEWELGDKKLVVKVDAKTNAILDEYKKKCEESNSEDHKNELDKIAKNAIEGLIKECYIDVSKNSSDDKSSAPPKPAPESFGGQTRHNNPNLDDIEVDDEKKDLIHREIGKFREFCQKDAESKDKYKELLKERDRDRKEREKDRVRSERDAYLSRDIERIRLEAYGSRNTDKDRDREHYSHRDHDRRDNDRDRNYNRDRNDKNKDTDDEEEEKERRRNERKLREKETAYQDRLKNWETRERKKAREYEKDKEKEEDKKREEAREAKRLKEFLEDYEDARDDPKYYRSSALSRRMKDRDREIESDNRDRQKEKDEIDELRRRLADEGHPDPAAEAKKRQKDEEARIREKLKYHEDKEKSKSSKRKRQQSPSVASSFKEDLCSISQTSNLKPINVVPNPSVEDVTDGNTNSLSGFSDVGATPNEEFKSKPLGFTGLKLGSSSPQHTTENKVNEKFKKKKMSVGDIFNSQDEDTDDSVNRKRKLVPLEYTEEEMKAVGQQSSGPNSPNSNSTTEEKRKNIKNLIEKIPTSKDELFEFSIDRSFVDNVLMEKRIRPWVNKKIIEYIGEEEPTLVEFICSKVMAGSSPKSILDDVSMVLDDEAEVFVVKMWRLLIYEIEAKKLGIGK